MPTKLIVAILCAGLIVNSASAAENLEEVTVVGVTPSHGAGLPVSKIPYNVQSATGADLSNSQSLGVTDFLKRNFLSISINDAQGNPLQPDLHYRGFTASPLLGLAQGLTVHENGIRINEPLGDTVNWDMIPESAIHNIELISGANPLFGLNTLGGALSLEMKNGFNTHGSQLSLYGGSFNRIVTSLESGGQKDGFAYYGNVSYFNEDGWRQQSPSDTLNFYGSLGWKNQDSQLNLNLQHGRSKLNGNGPLPVQLLALDRTAIFTAPDITENDMSMISVDFKHDLTGNIRLTGNVFYRKNRTHAFNGDTSNYTVCTLTNGRYLLSGVAADQLTPLGLNKNGICVNNVLNAADPAALETTLNTLQPPGANAFNIINLTNDLSGTGTLSDAAINNISDLTQKSYGTDVQITFSNDLFRHGNQLISGLAWYRGEAGFRSRLELSGLNPVTRSTLGLGTGTYVNDQATDVNTATNTASFYITDTYDLTRALVLTLSGRLNSTHITLADQSGVRPELNGRHAYIRFNPAVGITYQAEPYLNFYAGYSESSRAPTPIELSCNRSVYNQAVANAVAAGGNPNHVQFECRLPNAFLSDPPLKQVVAHNYELGIRGTYASLHYHLGGFFTTNTNDIIFQTTGRSTGLFANVKRTQRAGLESSLTGIWNNLVWNINYSFIDATFEDNFNVLSPNNPFADAQGQIRVTPGDRMPGIPQHQLKLSASYSFTNSLTAGAELIYNSDQYLRGDESNQLPAIPGYTLVNLHGRYRVNRWLELFARVNNLFDTNYANFGLLGDAPADSGIASFAHFHNVRFLGPGAPRSAFVGITLSM